MFVRMAILACIFVADIASASGLPRPQRKAMTAMVRSLVPTLTKIERRAFVDGEALAVPTMTRDEKVALLDTLADTVAVQTIAARAHARLDDVDQTRAALRDLARTLVRAAQIDASPEGDHVGLAANGISGGLIFTSLANGVLLTFFAKHVGSLPMSLTGIGFAFAGLGLTMNQLVQAERHRNFRFAGGEAVARLFDHGGRMNVFWQRVDQKLREASAEGAVDLAALKSSIDRELKRLSFDEACQSAFLLEPPRFQWP